MNNEDHDDVNSFWFLPATAGVLILGAAVWVGPFITDSLPVQAGIACALVMTLVIASLVAGQRRDRRGRVIAIFFAWIAMTASFAVVYAVVYFNSPQSFRANRDLYDASVRSDLVALSPKLRDTLTRLYCVELLDGSAERIGPQLFHGRKSRQVNLTPDVTFFMSHEVHQRAGSDPKNPTLTVTVRLLWKENNKRLDSMVHTYSALVVDPNNRFIDAMSDLRSVKAMHEAIASYRAFLQSHLASLDREARELLTKGISLDISHFIFMSSTISTTIGSADVMPNSEGARYLVVLQAFCSVFLFGYAANVLWTRDAC